MQSQLVPFLIGGHTLEWKTYYYICIVIYWKNVKIHIFCAMPVKHCYKSSDISLI